jgi:hypothetical protein
MGKRMQPSRMNWMLNGFVAASLLFSCAAHAGEPEQWIAGHYAFSDELGGFTIRAISGTGTREDPIVLTEEFDSVAPATLIIRTDRVAQRNPSEDAGILFYLRVRTVNGSGHPWTEFEFELQEQLNVPSDYGDGLSFYQPGDKTGMINSDAYRTYSDDFEPYDRMIFRNGKIDPGSNGNFDFPIADFTPKRVFYLMQDPRIPST